MAVVVTFNGVSYTIPNTAGEDGWETTLSDYLQALASSAAVKTTAQQTCRVATTSPVTVSNTNDFTIVTDLSSPGPVTVNLPAGSLGRIFAIVDGKGDAATNNITISPNGSEQINGAATHVISVDRGGVIIHWNGTSWSIIGEIGSDTSPSFTDITVSGTATIGTLTATSGTVGGSTIATTNNTLTLTNKTINAGSNTITGLTDTNIAASGIANIAHNKMNPLTANRVLLSDGSGYTTTSSVTNTTLGYLDATSSIQTQLDSKEPTLTKGNLTETGSSILTITGGSNAVIGGGTTIQVDQASGSADGFLSSTDWTTFNNKSNYSDPLTTRGDILIRDNTSTTRLPIGTNGYVLTSDGTDVSWTAPTGGFTNPMTTEGDLILATTGGTATRLGIGTNGHILTSNGTTASWQPASGGSGITQLTGDVTAGPGSGSQAATIATSAVTYAKIQDVAGTSVIGRSTNTSGVVAAITAGTDHHVLRRNGTSLDFGLLTNNNIDASAAIAVSKLAAGTDTHVLTTVAGVPTWAAPASAGANVTLSNLTSPTAINQDLTFAKAPLTNYNFIYSGSDADDSDSIGIRTTTAADDSYSGGIIIETGTSVPVNSGSIFVGSRAANNTSGFVDIYTGGGSFAGTLVSGDIYLTSGQADNASGLIKLETGPTALDNSGGISLITGDVYVNTMVSGDVELRTGLGDGGGGSGAVSLTTGPAEEDSGNIELFTGNSVTGASGNITLDTSPTFGTTQGKIAFRNGSEGTAGHVWTSIDTNGNGEWAAPTSGFANPMTTEGDLILATTGGTATRLGIGSNGYVLTSNGTTASWQAASSGFADPMTTRGDIIYRNSSNATARLGAGANGYVLTSDGTDISWQPASGGSGITQLTGDVTAGPGSGSQAATIANSAVTYAKIQNAAGLSVLGRSTNSTGVMADITAGTDHFVLRRSGTSLDFGLLTNNNIDSAAAIARSKIASGTLNHVVINDGSGNLSSEARLSLSRFATGTSGHLLIGQGAGDAAFTAVSGDITISNTGVTAIGTGVIVNADVSASAAIDFSKLANGDALSVIGRSTNSAGAVASIAAGTDHFVLRRNGTTLGFGLLTNNNIDASAAIAVSKLGPSATPGWILGSDGVTVSWQPNSGFSSIASVANGNTGDVVANAADTYLTGSALGIGSKIKAGTILRWRMGVTKTNAGTVAPVFRIRFGTTSSTSDTARLTFTGVAQTAATDTGWIEITVVIRAVGASGGVAGTMLFAHFNTTTGLANKAQGQVFSTVSSTFDTTSASLVAGVSVNPGASGVWTFQVVAAEAVNLNSTGSSSAEFNTQAVSSNITLTSGTTYLVNTTAARSLTLPPPAPNAYVKIKDVSGSASTNNITIVRSGSEQIEGVAANKILQSSWGFWTFVSDGTNWFVV